MSKLPEFAPEYSPSERVRILVLYLAASAALVVFGKAWLFPAIRQFADSADCQHLWGLPGEVVLFYGLFVGIPLSGALLVGLMISRRGYKILRDRQSPFIGEKVFRPTPIRRDRRAVIEGYIHLLSPLPFILISIWGVPQAQELAERTMETPSKCAANHSLQGTSREQPREAPELKR